MAGRPPFLTCPVEGILHPDRSRTGSHVRPSAGKGSRPCHGSTKHAASSRAEIRWDKVLNKLSTKATKQSVLSTLDTGDLPLRDTVAACSAVPSDQVSLQDCPVNIRSDSLWGTAPPPGLTTSTNLDIASASLTVPGDATARPTLFYYLTKFNNSLLRLFNKAGSLFPGGDGPGGHSIRAPDSPVSFMGSRASSPTEMTSKEPDWSEDESLPPDQPPFTGLIV